ncbi:hypothetical protein AB0J35_49570 [Nonomuraea angiospora]|uniref:hypothetical protein n=1 Tax=Nonomuraea angiospora TaxID=46172 RepID=UPI0034122A26
MPERAPWWGFNASAATRFSAPTSCRPPSPFGQARRVNDKFHDIAEQIALESGEIVHVTVGCDPERLRAGRVIEAGARHDMAAVLLDEPVAETMPLLRWGSLSGLTGRIGCEIRYPAGNHGPERQIQAYVEPVTAGGDRFYEVEPADADSPLPLHTP